MAAADDRAGRPLPFCDVFHAFPFRRNPFSPCNLRPYLALKRLLAREHFDIIHCHTLTGGILARLAARKSRKHGTKVIYTAHGFAFYRGAPLWRRVFGLSESLCARWTDVLITINREDTRFAARALHPRRAEYVPGIGVDMTRYAHKESLREKTRSALGLSENTLMLLSVGRLDRNKNQKTMLRVLSALQKSIREETSVFSSRARVDNAESLNGSLKNCISKKTYIFSDTGMMSRRFSVPPTYFVTSPERKGFLAPSWKQWRRHCPLSPQMSVAAGTLSQRTAAFLSGRPMCAPRRVLFPHSWKTKSFAGAWERQTAGKFRIFPLKRYFP